MSLAGTFRQSARLLRIALAMLLLAALPTRAHSLRTENEPTRGLAITNLTHGQMKVMARWSDRIAALAERQAPTDERFRRISNHAALQRAACLWGTVPGSVANESNPFNGCMHATLGAERATLLEMLRLSPDRRVLLQTADAIEREMIASGAALVLCRFSGDAFDTARIVHPPWAAILSAGPVASGLTLTVFGLAGIAVHRGRMRATARRRRRKRFPRRDDATTRLTCRIRCANGSPDDRENRGLRHRRSGRRAWTTRFAALLFVVQTVLFAFSAAAAEPSVRDSFGNVICAPGVSGKHGESSSPHDSNAGGFGCCTIGCPMFGGLGPTPAFDATVIERSSARPVRFAVHENVAAAAVPPSPRHARAPPLSL